MRGRHGGSSAALRGRATRAVAPLVLLGALAACGQGGAGGSDGPDEAAAPDEAGASGPADPGGGGDAENGGGDGSGDGTAAPGDGASEDDGATASPAAEVHVLGLHSSSAAGGVTGPPVRLTSPGDVDVLGLDGRRAGRLAAELRLAVVDWQATDPGESWALAASVVSVGCARPVDVEVTLDPLEVTPVARAGDKGVQCLVPVTTVALLEVPVDAFA